MMKDIERAYQVAKDVRLKAHAPYSKFLVGAALVLENGEIIPGCNVENASYGGTICAERNAFCGAVAQHGKLKPKAMVLVTNPKATPCGLCLQVMAEFCSPEFPLYLSDTSSLGPKVTLKELLPHPFGPDKLK